MNEMEALEPNPRLENRQDTEEQEGLELEYSALLFDPVLKEEIEAILNGEEYSNYRNFCFESAIDYLLFG